MTIQQIEQLGLQRGAGPVGVEIREERILLIFTHVRGVEPRREPLCESGLAGADGAVDRDVSKVQPAESDTVHPAHPRAPRIDGQALL